MPHGRIFQYYKVRSFEVVCVEIVPAEIPIRNNGTSIVTSKWMDYFVWQELEALIREILDECSQSDFDVEFSLKEGSSVIIGYHFQDNKPSSGIYLTPRDGDDIHNNKLHVEDEDFVYYKLCATSLVVGIHPKKLNGTLTLPTYISSSLIERVLQNLLKKNSAMWTLNKAARKLVSNDLCKSERVKEEEASCEVNKPNIKPYDEELSNNYEPTKDTELPSVCSISNGRVDPVANEGDKVDEKTKTKFLSPDNNFLKYTLSEEPEDEMDNKTYSELLDERNIYPEHSMKEHDSEAFFEASEPNITSGEEFSNNYEPMEDTEDTGEDNSVIGSAAIVRSQYFLPSDNDLIKYTPPEECENELDNKTYTELLDKSNVYPEQSKSTIFESVNKMSFHETGEKSSENGEIKHCKSNVSESRKEQRKITNFFNKSKDLFSDSHDSFDFATPETSNLSAKRKRRKPHVENEKSKAKNSKLCKKDKKDSKISRKSSNPSVRRSNRKKNGKDSLLDIKKGNPINKNTRIANWLGTGANSISSLDVNQNNENGNVTKESLVLNHCHDSPLPIFMDDDDDLPKATQVSGNVVASFSNTDGSSSSSVPPSLSPTKPTDAVNDSLPDLNASFSSNSSFVDTKDELPDLMLSQNYGNDSPNPLNCTSLSLAELPDLMLSQNWGQETSEKDSSQDDFVTKKPKKCINNVKKILFKEDKKSLSRKKPKSSSKSKCKSTSNSKTKSDSSWKTKQKLKDDQNKITAKKYPPNFFEDLLAYSKRVLNPDWKAAWDEDHNNQPASTGDYEEAFIKRVYEDLRKLTFDDFRIHLEESLSHFRDMVLGNTDNERDKKLMRGQNFERNVDSETFVCILDDNICMQLCDLFSSHFEVLLNESRKTIPVVLYNYLVLLPELIKRILMSLPVTKERGITTDDQCEEVCYQLTMYGAANSP